MNETLETQDTPVFTYALASADLRYIEIGEREIYLRQDPEGSLIFRGEIAGCGPECHINLSEILLEYAMSCEGCSRAELATEMITHFGDHLGQIYVENAERSLSDLNQQEIISNAITCILRSMETKFVASIQPETMEFSLDCCPLSECARDTGLNRSVEMAYLAFIALVNSVLNRMTPEWTLVRPSAVEINIPLHQIQITH